MKYRDDDARLDYVIARARPQDATPDRQFTDEVMRRIIMQLQPKVERRRGLRAMLDTRSLRGRLRALPVGVAIIGALLGIALLGGAVYAAYQLWPKPQATVTQTSSNETGRRELAVSLQDCAQPGKQGVTYELKKNATIAREEAPQYIQAQCELSAIQQWAQHAGSADGLQSKFPTVSLATTLTGIDGKKVSFAADEPHGMAATSLDSSPDTVFVADAQVAAREMFRPGDVVVYVTDDTYDSGGGYPTARALVAVVKLNLPLKFYDPTAANSLTEIIPCPGNEAERCKQGAAASIDIYGPLGWGQDQMHRQVDGTLVSLTPSEFVVAGSSGAKYTFRTKSDIFGDFIRQRSKEYDGITPGVGDTVSVGYYANRSDVRTMAEKQLEHVALDLEMVSKTDALQKY